jgi:hypothetical protein
LEKNCVKSFFSNRENCIEKLSVVHIFLIAIIQHFPVFIEDFAGLDGLKFNCCLNGRNNIKFSVVRLSML